MQINGEGRDKVLAPIPDGALIYTPVPKEGGGYQDAYTTLEELKTSLGHGTILVTSGQSPYSAGLTAHVAVDTSGGSVDFTLPASPTSNHRYTISPVNKESYEEFPLFIRNNGNPIDGVSDDIEVDVNGLTINLVWVGGSTGWVIYR